MKELIYRLLNHESELLYEHKAAGQKVFRPSSILLILIAVLYCTSGIDLFPEKWVKPTILGFIDDILIVIAVAAYTYKDWSEFSEIRFTNIPFSRPSGESEVSMGDGDEASTDSSSDASTSDSNPDTDIDKADDNSSSSSVDTGLDPDTYFNPPKQDEESTTGDTGRSGTGTGLSDEERRKEAAKRREERKLKRAQQEIESGRDI